MVYEGATGKLTVPGLIDPTGLIFDEEGEANVPTGVDKGAIFVSDGSGGAATVNGLYYKDENGVLTLLSGGAAVSSERTISRQMLIPPSGATVPFEVNELDIINSDFTPTAVWVYIETAFTVASPGDITLDITMRSTANNPGSRTSIFSAPVPIDAFTAGQATAVPITVSPGTLSGPVVIEIKVNYINAAPTAGAGLVVALTGTV
jgi:hypothetical protein